VGVDVPENASLYLSPELRRLPEFSGEPNQGSKWFDVTTEEARALDEILANAGLQTPSSDGDRLLHPILPNGTWVIQLG
jgi:hypothetical protein